MSTTALGEALAEAATWQERREGAVALIDGPAAAARRERLQRIVGSELPSGDVRTLGDASWPSAGLVHRGQ